ncbi:MAG: EAL domain-containing protein [Luteibacter sp.]|uniref:EAL domain-containing protein n=1 Tax=Luteibacter sp. TaxID=1886636 RepID=UPI002808600A|nr:EAL domain-containing protein [Luteibacter sp.]MDQ7997239.1 EAL domain-containing protein [Luteibacter sp.]MDQ8049419.1 EAL domain-containing protein [Luteibacter sp.]
MDSQLTCGACRDSDSLAAGITMAFQPIVDVAARTVFAHEALVRGIHGEGAAEVLSGIDESNRYGFDQACRVRALECAKDAALPALVSINFLPNAVYNPEHCLRATLAAAERVNWPLTDIIFEVTEHEEITDHAHLLSILAAYRARGFRTAIDDFGAGYAGLNLLADFQPDLLKLDIGLIRNVHEDVVRQRIVKHMVRLCEEIGVRVIAEGVELAEEAKALFDLGISLQQGFFFARPALAPLPDIRFISVP